MAQHQTDYARDLYNVKDSVGEGVINSVRVHARISVIVVEQACIKICIKTGGIPYEGAAIAGIGTGFKNYSTEWNTNPGGGAWTWAQIDALQVGVALRSCHSSGDFDTVCTQIYVEVDYTLMPRVNPLISREIVSRPIIGRTRIR